MRKQNLITVATIMCMVTVSIFATRPTASETSANLSPVPTPSPIKKRPKPIQSPQTTQSSTTVQSKPKVKKTPTQTIEVENDETHLTNNPAYREGGVNNTTHVNRTTPATPGLVTNDTVDKIELIKEPRKPPTAGPCSSVTTNATSPNSGRSSTKVKNKNCQEFEAVRPNSPQTPNAAMYNPKELSVDKVVKKKPSKTKRP